MGIFEDPEFGGIAHQCWQSMRLEATTPAPLTLRLSRSEGTFVDVERTAGGYRVVLFRGGDAAFAKATNGPNDGEAITAVRDLLKMDESVARDVPNEVFVQTIHRRFSGERFD